MDDFRPAIRTWQSTIDNDQLPRRNLEETGIRLGAYFVLSTIFTPGGALKMKRLGSILGLSLMSR